MTILTVPKMCVDKNFAPQSQTGTNLPTGSVDAIGPDVQILDDAYSVRPQMIPQIECSTLAYIYSQIYIYLRYLKTVFVPVISAPLGLSCASHRIINDNTVSAMPLTTPPVRAAYTFRRVYAVFFSSHNYSPAPSVHFFHRPLYRN